MTFYINLELRGVNWEGGVESHVECYLWVSGAWVDVGEVIFTDASQNDWKTIDVTTTLTTQTKVGSTRLKLVVNTNVGTETAIWCARLRCEGDIKAYVDSFTSITVGPWVTLHGTSPYIGVDNFYPDYIEVIGSDQEINYFEFEPLFIGGPYISIGTIDEYFIDGVDDGTFGDRVTRINLAYARITDNLQTIIEKTITDEWIPWEWWIDYTGALQVADEKGSTKAVTVSAGGEIAGSILESSSKQSAQRVRVIGSGESATQDLNTSDWQENQIEMMTIHSFYESVVGDKTVSQKSIADTWAKVILAQSAGLRQEVTVRLEDDPYTANDFDVGDTITVTDPDTGLSGLYRIKTIDKTIDGSGGEKTVLTCVQNRTDITDRLADIYKSILKSLSSSTFIDSFMGEGGQQTKVAADTLEDIWEQTASNKWALELPEDELDAVNTLVSCTYGGRTAVKFGCDQDEFYISADGLDNADGAVYLNEPLLQFSRNPRFTCEFLISTVEGDVWQTNDRLYILIHGLDDCIAPFNDVGFGFSISKTDTAYDLKTWLGDNSGVTEIVVKHIVVNTKYTIEARLEWKEKIVKYYFGTSDVDKKDPEWGFKLRAILPLSLASVDEGNLCPFHVQLDALSGATQPWIYIYRYKVQAQSSISSGPVT